MSLLGVLEDMAKKYLSLEEAASLLDMTTEQLMKIREKGEIRGFADRGSWKFREQDVDEFQRSRQTDSAPDFPIITGDNSSSVLEEPDAVDLSSSDSDVRLFFDESLFDDDKEVADLVASGSDVRLSGDSGPNLEEAGSDDEMDLSGWGSDAKISDSDSDVKLVGAGTQPDINLNATIQMKSDSDSDVVMVPDTDNELNLSADSELKLSDSDSDVRLSAEDDDSDVTLAGPDATDADMSVTSLFQGIDSDSDVKLMGTEDLFAAEDSDSDVKLSPDLNRTDSDIRLAEPSPPPAAKSKLPPVILPEDSDLKLINKGSGVRKDTPDSGLTLNVRGSGLGLDADESGISLEMDSGISLEADDSGISLESYDSGISLEGFGSGVNLGDDSGISLDLDEDSGISIDPGDIGRTMPMQSIPRGNAPISDSSSMTTQFEIPKADDGDGEFELAGLDDDEDELGTSTGVLTFDDEEDLDSSRTVALPALSGAAVQDDTGEEEIEDEDAAYADEEYSDDEFSDDEDLDVHDSEEFDDDDFESGQSQVAGFPVTTRAVRADVDWSRGTKIMIGISAFVSVLCAVVGIELVRTMWLWTQPTGDAQASSVLQMIGGAF
jgi:hypothetical protein